MKGYEKYEKDLKELDLFINKNKHYYIICRNGSRSSVASKALSECGYNVTNVVGGIMRWPGAFVKNSERAYY